MFNSKLSMAIFSGYFALLSLCLLFYPSLFVRLGFESAPQPWVTITGYLLGVLAFLYAMAVRTANHQFCHWTVIARIPLLPFSLLLVYAGIAPPVMILLGLVDLLGASWTALALRHEQSRSGTRGDI